MAKLTDWKDGRNHRDPKWPVGGYAPGNYISHCIKCDGAFIDMDKRAINCFPCAIDGLMEANEAYRITVRKLEAENETLRSAFAILDRAALASLPQPSAPDRGEG